MTPTTQDDPKKKAKPGRKRLDPDNESVIVSFRLTAAQREQVRALGGSEWIRQMLDLVAQRRGEL